MGRSGWGGGVDCVPLALPLGDRTGGMKVDCTEAGLSLGVNPAGGEERKPSGWASSGTFESGLCLNSNALPWPRARGKRTPRTLQSRSPPPLAATPSGWGFPDARGGSGIVGHTLGRRQGSHHPRLCSGEGSSKQGQWGP